MTSQEISKYESMSYLDLIELTRGSEDMEFRKTIKKIANKVLEKGHLEVLKEEEEEEKGFTI